MRVDIQQPELFTAYFSNEIDCQIDYLISGISTDSRDVKEGDLFLGIKGEHFDGSSFVNQAIADGAVCSLAESGAKSDNVFIVDNVTSLIGKICARWMDDFEGYTIGITGTNGKTTSKDMIYHILSKSGYRACKTEGNFNTSIGVPLSIFSFSDSADYYVLELGANQAGDIKHLSSMIKPNCAIVTNISDAHLDGFGSFDNIIKEKTSIFDYSDIGFYRSQINIDYSNPKVKLLSDSLENFHYPEGLNSMFDKNRALLANAFTVYHACNAIMDISIDDFFTLIEDFSLPKGRGQVHLLNNNIKMIDDTYNANPESVKAAIDNLAKYDNEGRKIFVFGDMKELGSDQIRFHKEIGDYCSEKIDIIMCYGDLTKNTINRSNKIPIQLHFDTKKSLSKELCNAMQENDVILLKGSRSMKLDLIIEDIINYVK